MEESVNAKTIVNVITMEGHRGRIFRGRAYAARAYGSWMGPFFSIGTFLLVSYDDVLALFPQLAAVFANAFIFMFIGLPIVISILVLLGRWDFKKGSYPAEVTLGWDYNPKWVKYEADFEDFKKDTINRLDKILTRLNDERC